MPPTPRLAQEVLRTHTAAYFPCYSTGRSPFLFCGFGGFRQRPHCAFGSISAKTQHKTLAICFLASSGGSANDRNAH